jgi:RHS repeat-associated protein
VSEGTGSFATGIQGLAEDTQLSGGPWWYTRTNAGNAVGQRTSSANYYDLVDGLGSIVGLINSSGTLQVTYSYDAYGSVTPTGSGQTSNQQYVDGYYDSVPGLIKFGTRYYDPMTGRWNQQDPLNASIVHAAELNRYPYASDTPTTFTDPSGQCGGFFGCLGHVLNDLVSPIANLNVCQFITINAGGDIVATGSAALFGGPAGIAAGLPLIAVGGTIISFAFFAC